MNYITYLYQKGNIKQKNLQYLEECAHTLNLLIPTQHNYFNKTLYSNNYCLENKNNRKNEMEDIIRYKNISICNVINRLLVYEILCVNNIQLKLDSNNSTDDENIEIDSDFVWNIGIKYENNIISELISYINEKTKSKKIISNPTLLEELQLELEDENEDSYIKNKIELYIEFYFIKISTLNEFISI